MSVQLRIPSLTPSQPSLAWIMERASARSAASRPTYREPSSVSGRGCLEKRAKADPHSTQPGRICRCARDRSRSVQRKCGSPRLRQTLSPSRSNDFSESAGRAASRPCPRRHADRVRFRAGRRGVGVGGRLDLAWREGFETIWAAGIMARGAAVRTASPWIRLFGSDGACAP